MAYIAQWQLKFGERTLQPGDRVRQSEMDSLPERIRESLLEQHKIVKVVEVEKPAKKG